MESAQINYLCFLLLQISFLPFINTKSQLFTLKNNKIELTNNLIQLDEVFYIIISSTTTDSSSSENVWIKHPDSYEFAFESLPEWVNENFPLSAWLSGNWFCALACNHLRKEIQQAKEKRQISPKTSSSTIHSTAASQSITRRLMISWA